jgi:hypothetical protein
MLNLVGPRYDFANVLHAVLQECEHRRLAMSDPADLRAVAESKLAAIEKTYREAGGAPAYWEALKQEILGTAVPQYLPAATRQTALQQSGYGLWREGDVLARCAFALAGLALGALLIAIPYIPIIPIVERALAFLLALGGFVYPELRKLAVDRGHVKLMNGLLAGAAQYQATQLRYLSDSALEEAFATDAPERQEATNPRRPRQGTTARA